MTSNPPSETPDASSGQEPAPDDSTTRATVEAFLYDIDAGFAAEMAQAADRLNAARQNAGRALVEAGASLGKSREKLQSLLQAAEKKQDLDDEALRRLAAEIDGQLSWIFRKVRPAVDRELRAFAPRKKPIQNLLGKINRLYARATAALPDEFPTPEPPPKEQPADGPPVTRARQFGHELAARLRLQIETHLQISPRNVIEEMLAGRPEPKRHPLVQKYQDCFDQTSSRIDDIWRGIRFHLEVAADELEPRGETGEAEEQEGAENAAGAIASAKSAVEVLVEAERALPAALDPLVSFFESTPDQLTAEHQAFAQALRREFESVDSWDKTWHYLLRRLLRTLTGLRNRAEEVIDQGREEVVRSASSGLTQTGNILKNIQGLLGKGGKTEEILLTLTDLPTMSHVIEKAGRLPTLYQRLFTLGPLKNREFLVAREEELDELEDIFQRWQAGKACSVALVGPEGSGKTSLVNCFENQFGSKGEFLRTEIRRRVRSEADLLQFFQQWLKIEEVMTSPEDLVAFLLRGPRRVLIIEGGHHLGLRVIDGYRGVRAFLHVLMATRRHCLWLVTFRKSPWSRLDYQVGIGQHFTHQVRTLFHEEEQIREAIQLRHRTSGLPLLFAGEAENGKKGEEAQAEKEARFFRELFEASSGSIDAAIYFWLLSVSYDEQARAIKAEQLGKPEFGFIRGLGHDYLFALAEVISHGGLTSEEYCSIFRRDALEGRMLLDYLTHLNILHASGGESPEKPLSYSLNPIFFGPTAQVLESMNILY